ncbi:MAG: aspartate aminotransferase family protein [Alphaproteobacteria bacterium]
MTSDPRAHLAPTYAPPADLVIERGEGCWLIAEDGRRYLDFYAGIGVNALGHCHPRLVKALTDQAGKLWHTANSLRIPSQEALADLICANSFADRVFFSNSGAEAWECGLKAIRRYFWHKGEGHRTRMITVEGAFHGRTLAAISAAGRPALTDGFAPLLDGFDVVPATVEAIAAAITPETGSIHLEPISGEGGLIAHPPEFLQALRKLCDDHGLLLFLDEVQCGNARTGKLFAQDWAGITPDVVCTAKGMGGGFPVGACLMTAEIGDTLVLGSHGTTYGGNPLAMAVAHEVYSIFTEDGFMQSVLDRANHLQSRLEQLVTDLPDVFVEVRGAGLMRGVKLAEGVENTKMVSALRDTGLLTVKAGDNVVRLLPPLIVSKGEIDQAADMLASTAKAMMATG